THDGNAYLALHCFNTLPVVSLKLNNSILNCSSRGKVLFQQMCHLVERGIVLWDAVDLDQGHGPSETSKGEPYGDVARLSVQMTQFVFKCKILFSHHA